MDGGDLKTVDVGKTSVAPIASLDIRPGFVAAPALGAMSPVKGVLDNVVIGDTNTGRLGDESNPVKISGWIATLNDTHPGGGILRRGNPLGNVVDTSGRFGEQERNVVGNAM
jgi:hypothetical protein